MRLLCPLFLALFLFATPAHASEPEPLPPGMTAFAYGMATGRIVFGLAPIVAYEPTASLLGVPGDHDNPSARLAARLFGVRDVALGVLVLYSTRDLVALERSFLFNAAIDLSDAAVILIPLVGRDGIDRGASRTLAFALGGMALWVGGYVWSRVTRARRGR